MNTVGLRYPVAACNLLDELMGPLLASDGEDHSDDQPYRFVPVRKRVLGGDDNPIGDLAGLRNRKRGRSEVLEDGSTF